jgi:hypothetical protein
MIIQRTLPLIQNFWAFLLPIQARTRITVQIQSLMLSMGIQSSWTDLDRWLSTLMGFVFSFSFFVSITVLHHWQRRWLIRLFPESPIGAKWQIWSARGRWGFYPPGTSELTSFFFACSWRPFRAVQQLSSRHKCIIEYKHFQLIFFFGS